MYVTKPTGHANTCRKLLCYAHYCFVHRVRVRGILPITRYHYHISLYLLAYGIHLSNTGNQRFIRIEWGYV